MAKRNPQATRERIINAAIDIFSRGDFNEATMRDIARASGVSQANIYQHFKSKESLIFSIISKPAQNMKTDLLQHLQGIKGTHNKIRKMTWHYLSTCENSKQLTWLEYMVLSTKAWSEFPGIWDQAMEIPAIFRDILREGKLNGEVRQDVNIRVAGHLYFGGLRNIIVFWCLNKQFKYLTEEAAEFITDLIWESIKTPSSYIKCPYFSAHQALPSGKPEKYDTTKFKKIKK